MLNLKDHFIEERATGKLKKIYLPYTVQLHKNKDSKGDFKLFLVSAFRLFPQDESQRQAKALTTQNGAVKSTLMVNQNANSNVEGMGKQLRSELVVMNNRGEPASGFMYFTWKTPVRCSECSDWLSDYTYYYFSKTSLSP